MISGPELQRLLDSEPQKGADEPMLDYMKRYTAFYDQFAFTTTPAKQNAPTVKTTTVHTNKAA